MTRRPPTGSAARLLLVLGLAASPAAAQEQASLRITKADCDRLVKHVPAPDVAYQPSVDAQGRPVVPADLSERRLVPPETIVIDVEIDLLRRFGVPANPDLFDADAEVGEVVFLDGRFYFNGQPLQDEAEALLSYLCQRVPREQP